LIIGGCVHDRPVPPAESDGVNPSPVHLERPRQYPSSEMGRLGKALFFDAGLSVSGQRACASCHNPAHAYGPPDALPAQFGGPQLASQGSRAVPGLTYLPRIANFGIALDDDGSEDALRDNPGNGNGPPDAQPVPMMVATTSKAPSMVPQGGLFWDGRVDTRQAQAAGPLFNPAEMGNAGEAVVAERLLQEPYRSGFAKLVGAWVLNNPHQLVHDAELAIAQYEIEDDSFHAYTSKFDYWLEGKTRLSATEMRGYRAFNDPKVGNCAACHVDAPRKNGIPPSLTDYQYEALGVPRNLQLAVNGDAAYFDLGVCGPIRKDLKSQTQYCGMFRTPTLRNVATRSVFFHNGRYHQLREVLEFYNFRDTDPQKIYPRNADGSLAIYDDLPARYRSNIDHVDAPFDRHIGDKPAMSDRDMDDIIAFLNTLTDGYQPGRMD
jgi:cytochrome c peroxidase